MTLDPLHLLYSLHGNSFRMVCDALQEDYDGLSSAARAARRKRVIDPNTCRRLERIDTAFATMRHLNGPKVKKFQDSLEKIIALALPSVRTASKSMEEEPEHDTDTSTSSGTSGERELGSSSDAESSTVAVCSDITVADEFYSIVTENVGVQTVDLLMTDAATLPYDFEEGPSTVASSQTLTDDLSFQSRIRMDSASQTDHSLDNVKVLEGDVSLVGAACGAAFASALANLRQLHLLLDDAIGLPCGNDDPWPWRDKKVCFHLGDDDKLLQTDKTCHKTRLALGLLTDAWATFAAEATVTIQEWHEDGGEHCEWWCWELNFVETLADELGSLRPFAEDSWYISRTALVQQLQSRIISSAEDDDIHNEVQREVHELGFANEDSRIHLFAWAFARAFRYYD